jgi:hypothetical protein|tara:strand:- start:239 stop:607 length:369 start_codon:yes stop_codon:yes gene_type:complete
MSSTRLNNDKGEYCKRQREIRLAEQFSLYKYKCISNDTAFPAVGINMPKMTNGYNNNILSQNAADIESALFGIGSTNLVNAKQPVVTKLNQIKTKHFFDRLDTFIPEPLVIEKSQRPKGPFC